MTRYDPFSYGQVKLGGAKEAPAQDPDDLLFADAGPQKAPPADADWALLNEDVGALLPGSPPEAFSAAAAQFAGDILGEDLGPPPAAPVALEAMAPRPALPKPAPTPSPNPPRPAKAGASGAPPARVAKASVRAAVAHPIVMRRPAGLRGALVWLLPMAVVGGGGSTAAWLFVAQQNPILGGIVGLSAAVAGLFARLALRD